jgi:hypothetical protein
MANAFVNASNLADISSGTARTTTPSGSGMVPQSTINTLANILAACINSTGAVTGPDSPTACYTLLNSALSGGTSGTVPADTAAAAINIAHHPSINIAALYALASSRPPFAPSLTTLPNDFSLGLVFTGGGMKGVISMAVDAMGNVWSTSSDSYVSDVTEISSAGVFLSGPGGYSPGLSADSGPMAIDTLGNVWIGNGSNSGGGSLIELSPTGTVLLTAQSPVINPSSGYDGLFPAGLAIDANSNIWVADTIAEMVDEFSSSGQLLSGPTGFTGGGMDEPDQLAISPSGGVWIANRISDTISELSSSGAPLSPSTGIAAPAAAVAIDHQGNVWTAGCGEEPKISKVSPSGAILSGSGFVGGGIDGLGDGAAYIAIDGDGNVWVPLYSSPGIVELSNAGDALSGATGYFSGVATTQGNIVIDGSGDIWDATETFAPSGKRGVPGVYTYQIVETIGIAAPVVTPLAAGVQLNMLGARP